MPLPDTQTLANIVYKFFRALDSRDNDVVVSLFARDGVWVRQGISLLGPEAVRAALEQRDPARHTAHLVTNLRVEQATEGTARVRFYMTAFETTASNPASQMLGVRDSVDDLVLQEGHWRIARKESRRLLPPET